MKLPTIALSFAIHNVYCAATFHYINESGNFATMESVERFIENQAFSSIK
jgi:hypothetical protein